MNKISSDAVEILHRLYVKGNPALLAELELERIRTVVASVTYAFRTDRRWSREQMAERFGTTVEVIEKIEDANW